MQVVILETIEECNTLDALVLAKHFESVTCENYKSQTTRWDTPKQKTDGDYTMTCCEMFDYTDYTIEDYNEDNYPEEE